MIRSILFLLAAAFVALINIPSCLIWHFRSRTDKAGAYDKATRICHTWIRPIAKLGGVDLKKRGAEVVLLACTELPVAFEVMDLFDDSCVDPTEVLAAAAIRAAGAPVKE